MPAPQTGSPMTYMLNGRQYIVVAISGGNYSGELVAFRLPQEVTTTAQLIDRVRVAGSARARCFARGTRSVYMGRVAQSGPAVMLRLRWPVLGRPARAVAHDIPNDVIVQAFLKPEGQRLRFLVRVPLEAMRDVVIPAARGPASSTSRAQKMRYARRQLSGSREKSRCTRKTTRLPVPELVAVRVSLPSDRSFQAYETALAHITGPPLTDDNELPVEQGLLDAWIEYPIAVRSVPFCDQPRTAAPGAARHDCRFGC